MGLLLYTRRGCLLCDTAADLLAVHGRPGSLIAVDVDDHPDLQRRFGDRVPVLEIDGCVVMEGRFDEVDLVRRLARLDSEPRPAPGSRR